MKPAAGKLLFILIVTLICFFAPFAAVAAPAAAQGQAHTAAAAQPPAPALTGTYDLLAHGNDKTLWVAEVLPNNDALNPRTRTIFKYRRDGDGANWRPIGDIAARVVGLSDRGSELIVLLENGDWMMVTDSGARSGPSLPGQGNIAAIAGDANNVWAIGEDLRPASTTEPSTAPAAQSTTTPSPATAASAQPSSRPAAARATTSTAPAPLGLFNLERGGWNYRSDLPDGVRANDVAAMTLLDQRPFMAVIGARDQQLRLYALGSDNEWSDPAGITTLPPDAKVNLMNLSGRPVVAVTDRAAGTTTIYVGGAKWSEPIKLEGSPEAANLPYRAVTAGIGQLRMLASNGNDKIVEQPYDLSGKLAGKATQSTQAQTFAMDRLFSLLVIIAFVVLLVVMLGTLRQRAAIQQAARHLDQLHIAPLSHRFAAAIMDAVPLLVAFVIASPEANNLDPSNRVTAAQLIWLSIGVAVAI